MTDWQAIETAPKDGTYFLATDGKLLGVGYHHISVEPETVLCVDKWRAYYDEVHKPFRFEFTANGLFPEGLNYLENSRRESEAWEQAKGAAPPFEQVPNPKAGEVTEWDYAQAFYSYDGSETQDHDGPLGFTPTHWMPMLEAPKPALAEG